MVAAERPYFDWHTFLIRLFRLLIFTAIFVKCYLKEAVLFGVLPKHFGYLLWISNLFPNCILSSVWARLLLKWKLETIVFHRLGCNLKSFDAVAGP